MQVTHRAPHDWWSSLRAACRVFVWVEVIQTGIFLCHACVTKPVTDSVELLLVLLTICVRALTCVYRLCICNMIRQRLCICNMITTIHLQHTSKLSYFLKIKALAHHELCELLVLILYGEEIAGDVPREVNRNIQDAGGMHALSICIPVDLPRCNSQR